MRIHDLSLADLAGRRPRLDRLSSGVWNQVDYRPREGFVYAATSSRLSNSYIN